MAANTAAKFHFFLKNWDSLFTLCKAEQALQGMELQEKRTQKDTYRKPVEEKTAVKRCLLILDLKPFRS